MNIHRTETFVLQFKDQESFIKIFNLLNNSSFADNGVHMKSAALGDTEEALDRCLSRCDVCGDE